MAGDALLALSVLRKLSQADCAVRIGELENELNASRSSLYRITRDLAEAGWLKAEGSPTRYSVTWKTIELGLSGLSRHRVRDVIIPQGIEFSRISGHGCAVSFYDRGEVVWTDRIRVMGQRVSVSLAWRRAPAACVSSGKILLAFQPQDEIDRVAAEGLPQLTERTKTSADEIRRDIAETRVRGYGLSDREHTNRAGLAFPILDGHGNALAALAVTTNEGETLDQMCASVLQMAKQFAELASAEMGRIPTPDPLS